MGKKWTKFKKKNKQKKNREYIYYYLFFKDVFLKLASMKKLYVTHKFEVYNNAFHWPKIINSIPGIGEIYLLDYSDSVRL